METDFPIFPSPSILPTSLLRRTVEDGWDCIDTKIEKNTSKNEIPNVCIRARKIGIYLLPRAILELHSDWFNVAQGVSLAYSLESRFSCVTSCRKQLENETWVWIVRSTIANHCCNSRRSFRSDLHTLLVVLDPSPASYGDWRSRRMTDPNPRPVLCS